ncbi:hypothetical protein [Nannocystis bainbridge]|uniref:Transposase n=1 Tax=Nannocystis bainbridge TaxID=2995303 RepID=A0ABT5DWL9_9BACT|nr:hypothetical protein [Nannocystis bainbridge]MDC0717489.1 hypothetical protein [Nannocystis bainbridge]
MRRRAEPETAAYVEPIKERHRRSKYLSENLAPLHRFLLSRVGRRWDAVHSEIAAHLRVTSAVQKHVLDHLRDMVYTNVVKIGDSLYEHGSWGVRPIGHGWRRAEVYVCPDSGLLKKLPFVPGPAAPPPEIEVVLIDREAQYRKIDGQWYRITLSPLPSEPEREVHDLLLGDLRKLGTMWQRGWELNQQYGYWDRYATAKRQISKRELRRLPPGVR